MNRGIYPVISGALTLERQLELASNNLANVQTAGFKKDDPIFGSILVGAGGPSIAGIDLYPQVADVLPDQAQGTLRQTDNEFDVALEGEGFLVVSTSRGLRYFRGGTLQINGQGQLATHTGDPLLGKGGPVKLPVGEFTIDKGGAVRVNNQLVDQLRIEQPPPSIVPERLGNLYWKIPPNSQPATSVTVNQGMLEQANVNPTVDMVGLITVARGYEQMQKAIQTMDDLTAQAIQSGRVQ